jgi:hypothetical protein
MLNRSLFLLFIFSFSQIVFGQKIVNRNDNYINGWTISLGTGLATSFSDVKQNIIFPVIKPKNEWRMGANFMLTKDISQIWNLRGQALFTEVAGVRKQNNIYFEAELVEINVCIAADVTKIIRPYRSDDNWYFSIFIGTGLTYYNAKLFDLSNNEVIAERGFGNGSGLWGRIIEGIMIGGIEVDYKINENWGIRMQSANRWMDSDSFDNRIGGFPYDFYNFTSIGVTYKFYRVFNYPEIDTRFQSHMY